MRTALETGKDGFVDLSLEVVEDLLASLGVDLLDALAVEDERGTRTTQRLVCGGRHNVGVLERIGDTLGRDEARHVRHVGEK